MARSFSNHPDHVRTRTSQRTLAAPHDPLQALSKPSPHRPADNAPVALLEALQWLIQQDCGWMRIIPVPDENAVWLKWKFTSRTWPNHYVMVKCQTWQIAFGTLELKRKVVEVLNGEKAPALDRPAP